LLDDFLAMVIACGTESTLFSSQDRNLLPLLHQSQDVAGKTQQKLVEILKIKKLYGQKH